MTNLTSIPGETTRVLASIRQLRRCPKPDGYSITVPGSFRVAVVAADGIVQFLTSTGDLGRMEYDSARRVREAIESTGTPVELVQSSTVRGRYIRGLQMRLARIRANRNLELAA